MSLQRLFAAAFTVALAATAVITTTQDAGAHCQVPCGIYDDGARIKGMLEDVATITKATNKINAMAAKVKAGDAQSINQTMRWVMTKEEHASRIITTVSEYFLTQKLKPVSPKNKAAWAKYTDALAAHHKVMRLAMKTKQGVDAATVKKLGEAVQALEAIWPHKH